MSNNGFPGVTIEFDGAEYEVPGNRVWGLINAIEHHTTFTGLSRRMSQGDISRTSVCSALAAALSYASGKRFTPEHVSSKLALSDMIDQAGALLQILSIPEAPKTDGGAASPGKSKTTPRAKKPK